MNDIRSEVLWFAERMERKLKVNDHKDHWDICDPIWLLERLREETNELQHVFRLAVPVGCFVETEQDAEDAENVINEAADVANFAMMIADIARKSLLGKEV